MPLVLQRSLFFITLASILSAGVYIQNNVLFNWDVSWLMHASERLLAGGTYTKDFFEINPPLILYLYFFPVLLTKIFHISFISSLHLFIYILSLLSLYLCNFLLSKITSTKLSSLLTLLLAVIYLIFPLDQFGQRENLVIIFGMPYFLLISCQCEKKQINVLLRIFISIFAALGFFIKPFFMTGIFVAEFYYLLNNKRWLAWIRIETITFFIFGLIYSIIILVWHFDYLTEIVPLAARNYYYNVGLPFKTLALYPGILSCYIASIMYFLYKPFKDNHLTNIIFLEVLAFLGSYFLQHTLWYFHLYPTLSLSMLLSFLLFNKIISRTFLLKIDYMAISVLTVLFAYFLFFWSCVCIHAIYKKNYLRNFIQYLQNYTFHKKIYFISQSSFYAFPLVDYSNSLPVMRFQFLGWLPGVIQRENDSLMTPQLFQDKALLINIIAEDITKNKPEFIFVETQKNTKEIEPLIYLLKNNNFKQSWKNYKFFSTLKKPGIYQFEVYKQNKFGIEI